MNKENLNSAEKTDILIKEVFGDEISPLKTINETNETPITLKKDEISQETEKV